MRINHKNFINLLGYCEEEVPFTRMMVFEYATNGSLFEHLHGEICSSFYFIILGPKLTYSNTKHLHFRQSSTNTECGDTYFVSTPEDIIIMEQPRNKNSLVHIFEDQTILSNWPINRLCYWLINRTWFFVPNM
jgi:hypothetical protein